MNETCDSYDYVDIGYGLGLGFSRSVGWHVVTKSDSFGFVDLVDYFRVVVLLERPYQEVVRMLAEYSKCVHGVADFPLWKIVGAGLASQTDQWAGLALNWFPELPVNEKPLLVDLLGEVVRSKWARQSTRQAAARCFSEVKSEI